MDLNNLTTYFAQYGLLLIFLIILLENLNFPGLPAGVVLPLAGVWANSSNINFITLMVVSLGGALLAGVLLYTLGRLGGEVFLKKIMKRYPKLQNQIERSTEYIETKGSFGIFIVKLIPVVRTVVEIPAGMIKMNVVKYFIISASAVLLWNIVFIGSGYVFGESVLKVLGAL